MSPLDDLTYDVVALLHAKAKALEAYEQYLADAADDDELRELFGSMRGQDAEHVLQLKEVLAQRLADDLGYDDEEDEDEDDIEYEGDEQEEDDDADSDDVEDPSSADAEEIDPMHGARTTASPHRR